MKAGCFEAANRLAGYDSDPIFVTLCIITRAERFLCRQTLITCALFNGAVSCRDYIQCWQKTNGIARSINVIKPTSKSEIFEENPISVPLSQRDCHTCWPGIQLGPLMV
jgi:hypothetical protein